MGIGRRTAAGNDRTAVRTLLPDAVGDRERVKTCSLEPEIPVQAGFCGGSPGALAGTPTTRLANAPFPFEIKELRYETCWRGWRSIARKRKNSREREPSHGCFPADCQFLINFPSSLDTEVNRWALDECETCLLIKALRSFSMTLLMEFPDRHLPFALSSSTEKHVAKQEKG